MSETIPNSREHFIEECAITPVGRTALSLASERGALETPEALKTEFRTQLIEIADAFDSMDHRITPMGSELQDDCHAVRELIRSLP